MPGAMRSRVRGPEALVNQFGTTYKHKPNSLDLGGTGGQKLIVLSKLSKEAYRK